MSKQHLSVYNVSFFGLSVNYRAFIREFQIEKKEKKK